MRHSFRFIFVLVMSVTSWNVVADVQYEDVCLEPSTEDPHNSRRITVDNDAIAMSPEGGVVSIFRKGSSGWFEESSIPQYGAGFGSSLQINNDTLIVGDYMHGIRDEGCAYIYRHNDGSWFMEQRLIPSKARPNDQYGCGVATDGTWAMVGPRSSDHGVCVYKFDGSEWNEHAYLRPEDHPASFGYEMKLDGTRLLVGSRGNNARAWVYKLDNEEWHLEGVLASAKGIPIGTHVDINGNIAIVGDADLRAGSTNYATIFRFSNSEWAEELLPQYPHSGSEVAIDGNLALVQGGNPDLYRVFEYNGTEWEHANTLVHSNAGDTPVYYGDCALKGNTAFIGIDANICLFSEVMNICNDLTDDDHVGVDDLLAVIEGWQNPYTVDDLLLVISSWGPCE